MNLVGWVFLQPYMGKLCWVALIGLGMTGLTGCFSSVRRVEQVQTTSAPLRTASVAELEAKMSARDTAIKTLNAAVLITASTGGGQEGKVKTYTSFRGYIFLQKPRALRVIMQLPVIGGEAMDMVSDGHTFTMLIPPQKRAIAGSETMTKPSKNALENLRSAVFFDSLLMPGVAPDEFVAVTESARIAEPAHGRKPAISEPDYALEVFRVADGHVLQPRRVVHISRVTLLPYEQDVFDAQGRVVTVTTYANYEPAGGEPFPRLVTITRPLDELSLTIQVNKVTLNEAFESDQFELKIPANVAVTRMD